MAFPQQPAGSSAAKLVNGTGVFELHLQWSSHCGYKVAAHRLSSSFHSTAAEVYHSTSFLYPQIPNCNFKSATMKCSTICAAFFAAVVAASSDVVQLKTDTFKEFVQENDLVLAECK